MEGKRWNVEGGMWKVEGGRWRVKGASAQVHGAYRPRDTSSGGQGLGVRVKGLGVRGHRGYGSRVTR